MDELVQLFRREATWGPAVENLRALKESHGEQAEEAAAEYANAYKGCRGAMIVDVVASRQRRYLRRVKPTEDLKDLPHLDGAVGVTPLLLTYVARTVATRAAVHDRG